MSIGQKGYLGIGREDVWGTFKAIQKWIRFRSETFIPSIEELISAALTAKRDEPPSYHGLKSFAGDIISEVHPGEVGYNLKSFFGTPLSAQPDVGSAPNTWEHIFTPMGYNRDSGTAEATTDGTKITDTTKAWAVNQHKNRYAHVITGAAAGQYGLITANAATELTVATAPAAALGDTYEILDGPRECIVPPMSIQISRDIDQAFQFAGCANSILNFSFGVGEKILALTSSWLAKSVELINNPAVPVPDVGTGWTTGNPFFWKNGVFGIYKEAGTAVALTDGAQIVTTETWTTDEHKGDYVHILTGSGKGAYAKIASNDTTTLTVVTLPAAAPNDTYEILTTYKLVETAGIVLDNGLAAIPLLNNSDEIAKIVGDVFRTGTFSPTFEVEDKAHFNEFMLGTEKRWCVFFEGDAIGTATDPGYKYTLLFEFPKVRITAYPLSIGGPGRQTVGATCKLKYVSTTGVKYFARATLRNKVTTYA
jgi:hypothetical protein